MMRQSLVVLAHCFGNFTLSDCEIIKLVHCGDVDMPYASLFFEPERYPDYLAVKHPVEIVLGINIMNHADINIIRVKLFELLVESGQYVCGIACAQILAVLPHCAQMTLDIK